MITITIIIISIIGLIILIRKKKFNPVIENTDIKEYLLTTV